MLVREAAGRRSIICRPEVEPQQDEQGIILLTEPSVALHHKRFMSLKKLKMIDTSQPGGQNTTGVSRGANASTTVLS